MYEILELCSNKKSLYVLTDGNLLNFVKFKRLRLEDLKETDFTILLVRSC